VVLTGGAGKLNGVVIDIATTTPEVRLWFDITNRSPIDLTLDRLLADI